MHCGWPIKKILKLSCLPWPVKLCSDGWKNNQECKNNESHTFNIKISILLLIVMLFVWIMKINKNINTKKKDIYENCSHFDLCSVFRTSPFWISKQAMHVLHCFEIQNGEVQRGLHYRSKYYNPRPGTSGFMLVMYAIFCHPPPPPPPKIVLHGPESFRLHCHWSLIRPFWKKVWEPLPKAKA